MSEFCDKNVVIMGGFEILNDLGLVMAKQSGSTSVMYPKFLDWV